LGFGRLYYTTKAATGLSFSDNPVVLFIGGVSATSPFKQAIGVLNFSWCIELIMRIEIADRAMIIL